MTAGKPTLANRVQALISSIFSFAMDADLVTGNPCARLRRRGVETVGRRVLSTEEIRQFWPAITQPPGIATGRPCVAANIADRCPPGRGSGNEPNRG